MEHEGGTAHLARPGPDPCLLHERLGSALVRWRDDVEAGGSELHAHEVCWEWAAAGLEVTCRTSFAQGHPPEVVRDGYRVIRRAGRYLVFPRAAFSELTGRHGPSDALLEIWNGMPLSTALVPGASSTWS